MHTSVTFLAFMAGFAIFGAGIFWLGHRRLRHIGREIDLGDPKQSQSVEYWRRIRGGGLFLLVFCSALLYAGLQNKVAEQQAPPRLTEPPNREIKPPSDER